MLTRTSKYRIREFADGFVIDGDSRPPVEVFGHPYVFEAICAEGAGPISKERFGLFNFGKLLEFVARGLMRQWHPQEGWFGARAWAQQQTARAIARRLREQWLRLLRRCDPTVLAVQKALFAATFSDAPLASEAELYRHTFLVQDVLRFPAAAIAVRNAWQLTRDLPVLRLLGCEPARQLREMARNMGLSLRLEPGPPDDPDTSTQLTRLADWKALFSITGHDYRSLNRTLMNLPGRVPHRQVCNLRRVELQRPLENRLELLTVVLYAGIRVEREDPFTARCDHGHLIQHAREEQIKLGIERLAAHLRQPLDPRKTADVRQLVQFLADFPEKHQGNFVGLTDKAIRWHRDRQQEQTAAMRRHYGSDMQTRLPPIALPSQGGIRFLDTVGAVCNEADRMGHCVASYIDLAVQGNCYLFHIDYRGEEATVEVGCEGKVRQSQGPRNQRNRASRWGKRILANWAGSLPPPSALDRRHAALDVDDVPF